jgi:amino acid transporter
MQIIQYKKKKVMKMKLKMVAFTRGAVMMMMMMMMMHGATSAIWIIVKLRSWFIGCFILIKCRMKKKWRKRVEIMIKIYPPILSIRPFSLLLPSTHFMDMMHSIVRQQPTVNNIPIIPIRWVVVVVEEERSRLPLRRLQRHLRGVGSLLRDKIGSFDPRPLKLTGGKVNLGLEVLVLKTIW